MKKFLSFLAAFFVLAAMNVSAAMFEASPSPLQASSDNVVITFHADQSGVAALQGLSTDLYAHIGVGVEGKGNWQHVKCDWNVNKAENTFKRVSTNTYQLTIGNLRSYFGLAANEVPTRICVIARTATGSAQTSDQFIEIYPEGFYLDFNYSPGNNVIKTATNFTFKASTTQSANIKIQLDGATVAEKSNVKELSYSHNFATPGKANTVKVIATNGSQTHEESVDILYITNSPQQNYPGGVPKQGAIRNSDGSVTFCVAAPNKSNVVLVGSWDEYSPKAENIMKYQDYQGFRYFWTTITGLKDSTWYPYYYLVDGVYKVGDPYAKLVLDPYNDKWLANNGNAWPERPQYPYEKFDNIMLAVYRSDIDNYNWRVNNFKVSDPSSLVIYELLVRDFTGTKNADGTYRGVIDKLPYLDNLGVSAIELLPIMEFDGNNSWGYATNFYMAPDKVYGSPSDLRELIDLCHQRGIAVILDIVFNHTPGLHPWYQMYDGGKSPFYNTSSPHGFGVYEDIKQEYGLWEKHWIDVLTYWLTAYKVDGFRFDLVKGLGDTDSYKYDANWGSRNSSIVNRMKRLHAAMKKVNPNVIHINEAFGEYNDECDMCNDGQFVWNNQTYHGQAYAGGGNGDLKYLNAQNCSRPKCQTIDYFESHDEQWVGYAAKASSIKELKNSPANRMKRLGSMAAPLLLSPGPKMIWQFGELGYDEELTESGRTEPKAVHWEYLDNANRKGTHDNYMQLARFRRNNPELFTKNASITYNNFGENQNARSIRVVNGSKEIVAFINPNPSSAQTVSVTTSYLTSSNARLVSATKDFKPTMGGSGKNISISVPANSFCAYATTNTAGVEEVLDDEAVPSALVFGGVGEINILGSYENVEVYTISGQKVGSLQVAPGLYIVNVDGNVTKVLVK